MRKSELKKMQRVLIVRLSAMGDILHAMPAVTALKAARPEWELGWLIEERWAPLLRAPNGDCPLVGHVHLTNMAEWRKSWLSPMTRSGMAQLISDLRAQRYDAVIDFQGAVRSAVLARLSGAGRVVGEDAPREWISRYLFSDRIRTHGAHVIEQDLELASALAGSVLQYTPALLPHDVEAAEWARNISSGRPMVLMNPGAGWGAKCWPAQRYGLVARSLWGLGCMVLINAGPAEHVLANQVVTESGGTARVVECTIQQLIELTRKSALFIGGDTGPLHLASALQVPAVAIFGPTDPARNGPYGTDAVVLRSPRSRRNHARHSEPEEGLLTISPADVLAAARNLLGDRI